MFKVWNIVDCALRRSSPGHHQWETKALVHELVRRGDTVRLFTHREAPAQEQFPGAEIVPTFSLSIYNIVSNDPKWKALESFFVHNRSFHSDLAGVDQARFGQSIALFPTLGENQLLGLFRWLDGLRQDIRPKVAICLMAPTDWSESDHTVRLYKTLWKDAPAPFLKEIAIFWRTPQLIEQFTKHLGISARLFPFVAPEEIFSVKPRSTNAVQKPMLVSFVGGARRERGSALIAEVVKQCAGAGINFFIQAEKEIPAAADLRSLPHVQVHEGLLGRDDYYRTIADSVVLLPYAARNYRWRDSGVYHEAKLLGAQVLATKGTSMANEIEALGNGLAIEHYSVAAIVDSVLRAQRELPKLRAAAARARDEFCRTQGAARCIDAIAWAFSNV
jgi:hypothetical protein